MAVSSLVVSRIADVTIAAFRSPSLLSGPEIEQLGEALYDLVDNQNCRKLLLDFHMVSLLASQMLGVLVSLDKKARAIKGRLVLAGIRQELMKVFKVTRLDKLLTFAADEANGMKKLDAKTV